MVFTLPVGAYRFRADYDGVPFWSGMENTCTLPECEADAVTLPGGTGQSQVTIEYIYDALNRLTSATYSNGTAFTYTYDAAGNVLSNTSRHYGLTKNTTYTYDDANQLLTAAEGETTWYYSYDSNGSLVMSSPSQGEANGATRNTYNKAGYLVKVEEHNGTAWQVQSEMRYDGLGNRLEMTAYDEGVGETIRYQLDNGQPLAAVGTESTSFYLYGRGVIGTKTDNWGYVLQDGLGSTRQLATHEGVIAMSVAYTPWGDVLEYYGSGGIDFGYLGGIYDDTTGLIYMGSGQYYDPVTGRLLTRGTGQSNPYKPGAFDPAGMMVAPLALIGLALGKKKKRGKWDSLIILLVVCVVVGISVSACGGGTDELPLTPNPVPTPPATEPETGPKTIIKICMFPSSPAVIVQTTITTDACFKFFTVEPAPTPTPIPIQAPFYNAKGAVDWAMTNYTKASRVETGSNCTNFVSQALRDGGGLFETDTWKPWKGEACNPDTKQSCKTPDCPWIQTGDLHSYLLSEEMGFKVRATFPATPDGTSANTWDYLLLRNSAGWSNFIAANIQPGDLVFYHDVNYAVWNHVALAIGLSGHTNFILDANSDGTKMIEPYVVEHDGPGSEREPEIFMRTMGDTTNNYIGFVEILYQP